MNLEYYNIFYQVALNGNITHTAQKLNMSQPSISRYIMLLEKQSNKKLFIRSKQGVKLTAEGHILFNYISKGLEYIKKAESELDIWKGVTNQNLTIAVSQLTIKGILPPVLEKFQEKNPNTKIKLATGSSAQAIANLQAGLADLAIVPDPIEKNPLLKITKLTSHENILICGKKYRQLQAKTLYLEDLNKYPFITLSVGTSGRKYIDAIFAGYGMVLTPEIEVSSSDLIPHLVKFNLGIGLVAKIFAEQYLDEGEVLHLKLHEQLPKRNFLLCTNRFSTLPPSGEIFIKTLLKNLKQ